MSEYYTSVKIDFHATQEETEQLKKLLLLMDKENGVSLNNESAPFVISGVYENALFGELEDLGDDSWGARYVPDFELTWAPKLIAALFPESSFSIRSEWENYAGGGTGVLEGYYKDKKLVVRECQTDEDSGLLTEEEVQAWNDCELEQDDIIRIIMLRKEEKEIQPECNPTYVQSFFAGEDLVKYLETADKPAKEVPEEVEQENNQEQVFENDCKKLMESIIDSDEGSLKRLLIIHTQDSLDTQDPENLALLDSASFTDLLSKGYLRFGSELISEENITQDCIILTEKQVSEDGLGRESISYNFTVICKQEICVLDKYKDRPLEICSVLNNAANGKAVSGEGKIFYLMSYDFGAYVPVGYNGFHLVCATQKGKSKPGKNVFAGYDKDIGAVIQELLTDASIREFLSIKDMSLEEAYISGFVTGSNIDGVNIKKGYQSWICIHWDQYGIEVFPTCKGKKQLKEIIPVIAKKVSGLKLPARGKIKYDAKNGKKEIALSDGYYTALMCFGK